MASQNVFHRASSHQIIDLECFADRYSIPWNLPTNFHPDLIATILQMHLLLFFVLLSQQSHLFPICVVSTYNESSKDLHKLCQIPRNCQCKWLLVSSRVPGTFASSFVFPEKFLFCTDTTRSIGWPSPAPRLHIDDCFEIHNFHWEPFDLLLSSHQNFRHDVRLRRCGFCTGPLWFWSSGRSRNFGLSGSEYKNCLHRSALLASVGPKDDPWEELACKSLCSRTLSSTRFTLNSCNSCVMSEHNGSSLSIVVSFFLVLDFWLAWSTSLPVLAFQHVTWHSCGFGNHPTQVSPFLSSHTFAWHSRGCHGWWGGRHWLSRYPFQYHSSLFCWSYASTLWSPQQILVPQV